MNEKSKVVKELTSFLGNTGSAGTILQVFLNSVILIIALAIGVYSVIQLMIRAKDVSSAKTGEERSEAIIGLIFPILGITIAVAAPAVGLWALNYFGTKTEIIKSVN